MHLEGIWRVFIAGMLFVSYAAYADDSETRSFALPDHGTLELKVPRSWQGKVSQRSDKEPPTILFTPAVPPAFDVLITPIWTAQPDTVLPDVAVIRQRVTQVAKQAKSQAVEKELTVTELKGPSIAGYYFSATDKAPKAGEFKYMTQGMARLDTLLVTFTVLTNDGQESVPAQTLAMLKTATHKDVPGSAGRVAPVRRDAIQITREDNSFLLTVPVSQLAMSIPAAGLAHRDMAIGGSTDNPRYFFFENAAEGINISGWFEPAEGYKGVKKLWEGETEAWKKRRMPEARDVEFSKVGNWEAIFYDNEFPAGTNAHVRAEWVQAGTWIDIHLSIATKKSSKDAREQLVSLLKSISVMEKK